MPFVNVRIVKEVIADAPQAKKARMAEGIVAAISDNTGIDRNNIWVVFEEVAAADWFVATTSVAQQRGGE